METIRRSLSCYRNELKGIAILWVVFFHAQLGLDGIWYQIQRIGYGGVDIFFFLSGFGLYHSLEKDADLGRYLRRRGERLLPAYLPFCLLWLAVMLPLHGAGLASSIRIALGNLTMSGYFAGAELNINWYVSGMALSLLLAPVFHAVLRAGKRFWLRASVLIGFLFALGLGYIGNEQYMAISRLPVFALGMAVGCIGIALPGLGQVLAVPVAALARYVEAVSGFFSRLTFSALSLDSPYYRLWLVLLYLILTAGFLCRGKRRVDKRGKGNKHPGEKRGLEGFI